MDQWRPPTGEIRSSNSGNSGGTESELRLSAQLDALKSGGTMSTYYAYGANPEGGRAPATAPPADAMADSLHLLSGITGTSGTVGMHLVGGMPGGQFATAANGGMSMLGMHPHGGGMPPQTMANPGGGAASHPTMQVRTGGQIPTGESLSRFRRPPPAAALSRQQVRTGEAVPSFPGSGAPSFASNGMGGMGGMGSGGLMLPPSFPSRLGRVERSSSEPTLNTMLGMFDHPPPPAPLDNNNMAGNDPPSGNGGMAGGPLDDWNAPGLGGGDLFAGMGGGTNSNPPGGGGGQRRHSEPTLSLLADIFDESTKVGGERDSDDDDDADHAGAGGGGAGGHRSAFSPVDLDGLGNLFGKPVSSRRDSATSNNNNHRPRANSAPQISEMMFELQNLEPEHVFNEAPTTPAPSGGLALGQDALPRDRNFDVRTGAATGEKRSRSVDPLEMFRRNDDLLGGSSHGAHAPPQLGGGLDQGLSQDDQRRLESLGIYSRDRPKRRRSAPLLNQDIFGGGSTDNNGTAAKGEGGGGGTTSATGPQANANLPQAGAPGQKNNVNLIQMLLGIEGGMGHAVPGGPAAIGVGGPAELCPEIPNTQFKRANSAPLSSQSLSLSLSDVPGSSTQVFHTPRPQRPQMELSASMLPQQFPALPNDAPQQGSGSAAPQQPAPLNINNADDLNLVLSAVKETQTNLQTLQPMVMQLGDPEAMEEIAKAFKITASSSQYVLASDLPSAYAALNDAWSKIKTLEERLAKGPAPPQAPLPLPGLPGATLMEQMLMQSMVMNHNPPPQAHHPPLGPANAYVPIAAEEAAEEAEKPKPRPRPAKPRVKKPTPPPSPIQDVIALEDLPTQDEGDPDVIMERLKGLMERTQMSQKQLQQWDRKNGLPKSHSQTMVNSNRSRKQLQHRVMKLQAHRPKAAKGRDVGASKGKGGTARRSNEVPSRGPPRGQNDDDDPAIVATLLDGATKTMGGADEDDAGPDPEGAFNDNVLDVLNMCT